MLNFGNERAQEAENPKHGSFIADIWKQFCEINIASPNTRPEESVSPSKSVTAADQKNIARLEEQVRLLKVSPEEGRVLFQQIHGADMAPDKKSGWSADSFAKMGLRPELGNPAYYGHKTIKGVAFLDVDDTQSNHREWTPHSALDRALFIIECAQQGIAVVPVTGSPMTGGDRGYGVDGRLADGELFSTQLLFTSGGAAGYGLEGGEYGKISGYQREVQKQIDAYVGRWQEVHDLFMSVAEEIFIEQLGEGWATNAENLAEFNKFSIAAERFVEPALNIPFATVQSYFPLENADQSGRVNFYLNVPSDDGRLYPLIDAIDSRFRKELQDKGFVGLTCFPGYVSSFGEGDHITQWSYDIGVVSKQWALFGLKRFEEYFGIPLDAFATISFGGDGTNDPHFVPNFGEVIKKQAPELLSPHGVFLVQTSKEQERIAESVIALGWPKDRLIVLSEESHGTLWCERLRNGLRESLVLSD